MVTFTLYTRQQKDKHFTFFTFSVTLSQFHRASLLMSRFVGVQCRNVTEICVCVSKKPDPSSDSQTRCLRATATNQHTQHNYGQLPPVVVASTCLLVTNLNEVASTSFCHGITFAKELFFAHPSAFAAPCS